MPAIRLHHFLLLFSVLLANPLFAASPAAFPHKPAESLQLKLEALLASVPTLAKAAEQQRLALALVVLDDTHKPAIAMINGDNMMYAASLPKIAILYGAAVAIDEGRLKHSDGLDNDIVAMIRNSCNDCATRVLLQVGRNWLLDLLQSKPFRFYDVKRGGGLWVGKEYAAGTAYRRDPLNGISHGATAWQVARWYYFLMNGELASPEQTSMMMDALSHPAIPHKFVKGLSKLQPGDLYRKSGTWKQFHADSLMIDDRKTDRRYILVAMAEDNRGGRWLEQLAPRLHDMAKDYPLGK